MRCSTALDGVMFQTVRALPLVKHCLEDDDEETFGQNENEEDSLMTTATKNGLQGF